MPYCEKCDNDYPIGTLVCPNCHIGLLFFKIEGMSGFKKIRLETIMTIYRWLNEEVAEKGSFDWEELILKTCYNIGATRKKAMEYIEIVKRLIDDEAYRGDFERRYRMSMYEHIVKA